MSIKKTALEILKAAFNKKEIGFRDYSLSHHILKNVTECPICSGHGHIKGPHGEELPCENCKELGIVINYS